MLPLVSLLAKRNDGEPQRPEHGQEAHGYEENPEWIKEGHLCDECQAGNREGQNPWEGEAVSQNPCGQDSHDSGENREWREERQEGVYEDETEDGPYHPGDETECDAHPEPEYPQFDYVDDEGNGYNDPNDGWQEDQGWY